MRFFFLGVVFAVPLWVFPAMFNEAGVARIAVAFVWLAFLCATAVVLAIRVRRMERTGGPAALVAPARRVFLAGQAVGMVLFGLGVILRV